MGRCSRADRLQPPAGRPRLAVPRRRRRTHAVLAARSDHARERLAAPGGVDLSLRRRACGGTVADPVQPDRRAWRALRDVASAEGLRARRRHRRRAVVVRRVRARRRRTGKRTRRQSRRRVLGSGRRPAHPCSARPAPLCAGRGDRKARPDIRSAGQRQPQGRPRRSREATCMCSRTLRGRSTRTC